VAVRIRMKQMGRTHRHYYRIVAIDARQPRDGRVIEELGSYDPRIKYWQSVGALPSEHVAALLKKFKKREEEREAAAQATPPAEAAPQA
jgi:small subunit ribosomal protein S16